jgi:hypothetical protein
MTAGIGLLMFVQNQAGTHQEARTRAAQLLAEYTVDSIETGRKWVEAWNQDRIIALVLEDTF